MRGVGVWSQKESHYRIGRNLNRWWPRLAWFLTNMAVSNAYVLCARHAATLEHCPPAAATQEAFRRALMHALVGTFTARNKRDRPSHTLKVKEGEEHIPRLRMPQRPCVVCAPDHSVAAGGYKPGTTERCETCGVAVHIACWKLHLPHEEDADSVSYQVYGAERLPHRRSVQERYTSATSSSSAHHLYQFDTSRYRDEK